MKFAGALISMGLLSVAGTALLGPEPTPAETVAAWPVVRGSIGGEPMLWYAAFERREGVQLCPLESTDSPFCRELEGLPMAQLRTQEVGTWALISTFFLAERLDGTVPARALKHSRYVSQLVAGSRAPPQGSQYEPTVEAEVQKAIGASTRRLSDGGVPIEPDVDEVEFSAWTVAWARQHRNDDALFDAFTRHLSIGACSYDATPVITARLFAELALARRDLSTFVDLQIRLISSSFERVARSNFGQERQPTYATALLSTNVDLDELFLGLLIRHPGAKGSVDDWRLARAIREARRTETMLPLVEALATDESLDAYNRFRATEVWLHLQVFDEATNRKLDAVKASAARLQLHPISRMRVDAAN